MQLYYKELQAAIRHSARSRVLLDCELLPHNRGKMSGQFREQWKIGSAIDVEMLKRIQELDPIA